MKQIRILHVYRTYYPDSPGGVQESIRQISTACRELGVDTRIFTLSPSPHPEQIERAEARVFRSRSWAAPASCDLGGFDSFRKFAELSSWADLIHYHFPWPFADLLHFAIRKPPPTVMTYHSDIVRQRLLGIAYTPLMYHTLESMSAVVATSPTYVSTSSVLSDSRLSDRVHVIPLGINEDSYPVVGDDFIFQRIGLDRATPFFLFIGVLRYYKGLHSLIDAASWVDESVRIVIAGSGPEGPKLKEQARQIGLKNVIFADQISDSEKVSLLKYCRALILPSHLRSEAYGMVLVEASMYAKPMISCEIGTGTSFVNLDGQTGFVVPSEKPVELAKAIDQLALDTGLANILGRNARSRYEKMFSGPVLGKAYTSLYQELL